MYNPIPRNVARSLRDAGLTLPKESQAALDALTALAAARDADPAAEAVAAAGSITARNAAARLSELATALTVKDHAATAFTTLEQPLARRFFDGLRDAGDDLITAMRPRFDTAAAVVHTAGRYFPPGASKSAVLDAGDQAVTAYRDLDAALDTLARIRNARVILGDLSGQPEQHVSWFIAKAADAAALDNAARLFTAPGNAFHNLAHGGYTLRLNTRAEAAQVARGAHDATTAREVAEAEARGKELRESMPWLIEKAPA
ncbi:MAG: hypothetical protein LCH77_09760 [Actinobacteria bacterium]|uniref:Uncharacterized protein n=1 Tax=Nostocoides veronense TaxID=330836 RepID=A0ABN2LC16_9MICO|nr:hypothetical protein [Actinomycetota bacterium]